MPIAELQVYSVEEADVTGGVCVVRCVGGTAHTGQVYAAGELRLGLRRIERYGRPVASLGAGHVGRVHLTGAVVALLSRGQVLTSVPPDGHSLELLEQWLATGPPLDEEPRPRPLHTLAAARMRDERAPDGIRLRWGRVALAAALRRADAEGADEPSRGAELVAVRGYLLREFGPGRGGDPAALCREVLALLGSTPEAALAEAGAWRELPRPRILHLRRIKHLLPWLALVRPHLADDDPLASAADAWEAVRPRLP
ncbi:hypothetical protein [Streptomyces subrutilus]|uniref:hypothetical protein n=1 Tax=Streptomyces subrutilus TaxID=36818 RepID=UPI002E11B663|nr:hypothetical protein OG479_18200 [Streptomyces subrutilus]